MMPELLDNLPVDPEVERARVASGLVASRATIEPKHFYDTLGSRLFSAITVLEEYYPTRTEAAIMDRSCEDMAQALQATGWGRDRVTLIDLGAGDGAKAAKLFKPLSISRYLAIDISAQFLGDALKDLAKEHPDVAMVGIAADFSSGLSLPSTLSQGPALVFYPGSSIGNFDPDAALQLLREIRHVCDGGGLLIGVDLVKDTATLEAAYADPLGVTAAFNLNVLLRMNGLLGANFEVQDWAHVAFYNETEGRIEMHLEARRDHTVSWPGGVRSFSRGERIHTENSYKWQPSAFEALLRDAGFSDVRLWTDDRRWFGVMLALV